MEADEPHMILFDTNVIIDMSNNPENAAWDIYSKEPAAVCGITITELYRGFRNDREKEKIERLLSGFQIIPIEQNDWKEAGLLIAELRDSGVTVPFQDAIIAYLVIKNNCVVLTSDKHFKLIKACDERLQLMLNS